jgi:anti-sigma regulatory factor (Ser/Thr protein kinase)
MCLGNGICGSGRPDPVLTAQALALPEEGVANHLDHPALLYGSHDEFLQTMVPFVRAGFDADEFVFVAARADNLAALRDAVGRDAERATWADTAQWHPHTGRRLRAFHDLVTRELDAGATRVRLAGEPVWPSGSADLTLEWQRYESVLNHVLAPFPATLMCLYDASRLDETILQSARRNHPGVHENGVEGPSLYFQHPEISLHEWVHELGSPPPSAALMLGTLDLPTGRRFVKEHARDAGVSPSKIADLGVAVSELLSNAFIHAAGPTALWTWTTDGSFVCQVDDIGPGIDDPIVGYRPPTDAINGRGLWIVRQLVDLVQLVPTRTGMRARIHMRLSDAV